MEAKDYIEAQLQDASKLPNLAAALVDALEKGRLHQISGLVWELHGLAVSLTDRAAKEEAS